METIQKPHISVLIVDDEQPIVRLISRRLAGEEGIHVYTLSGPHTDSFRNRVLDFAEHYQPDVILTDVNLGGEIGFAIIHAVAMLFRGLPRCPKFMVMTGDSRNIEGPNSLLHVEYPDVVQLIAAMFYKPNLAADEDEPAKTIRRIVPIPAAKPHEKVAV